MALTTTGNAITPGLVVETRRSIWQLGDVHVFDGGPGGTSDPDGSATPFLRQGVFIPVAGPAATLPPMKGVVAAGHPLTAEAGAKALRAGGNAFDAAVTAVLASFAAESPLTGLGAGGFMLAHVEGQGDHLLDFFVEAGGRGLDPVERRADLVALEVLFDDVPQVFNVGPASCGVPGTAAGLWEAARRWCTMPFGELIAAGGRARAGGGARHAGARLRVQDTRADPDALSGDRGRCTRQRAGLLTRRRPVPLPRSRRRARAAGGRGAGLAVRRRDGAADLRLGHRARRACCRRTTSRPTR